MCKIWAILWKVTVAVENFLVNVLWVCPLLPGNLRYRISMGHNAPKDVSWGLGWVYMMVHTREDCIPTCFLLAARHPLCGKRPMIFCGRSPWQLKIFWLTSCGYALSYPVI